MFLDWPVDPFASFDQSRPSLYLEVSNDEQQRGALPPPQVLQRIAGWGGCGPFLARGLRWCITWNTRGLVGSVFSKQKNKEFKLKYLKMVCGNNNILCVQEVHGRDEYLQAIQVLAPRFRFLVLSFLETKTQEDEDLLSEEAIVTHLITCQGRDHIVNTQSGRQSPVIVNVHFEPELTLRRLRERLRLITPHSSSYPNALCASSWVISTSVIQKKDDLLCGTRHSPMVTRERLPCSTHFSTRR